MGEGRMAIYKLHPDSPDVVQDIVYVDQPRASYTHAFGLTKGMDGGEYGVVVGQPVYANMAKMLWTGTLKEGFESPEGANAMVHLLPMDGGAGYHEPVSIELDRFFFGHFLNTWSPGPGKITFDLNRQAQIFFDRFTFEVQGNKAKRDSWAEEHGNAYSTPTRYEVDLETRTVTSRQLFPDVKGQCAPNSKWCEFDLYSLHPDDFGRPYCGFWAQQVFFNSSSFGAQGVVRVELCGPEGPKVAASWYQRNAYPGEAQFVPKPGSKDKTEGVMIFKIFEGDTGYSKIIVADAKTMKTIASATLPIRIPLTIHGNWYPTDKTQGGHCIPAQMTMV